MHERFQGFLMSPSVGAAGFWAEPRDRLIEWPSIDHWTPSVRRKRRRMSSTTRGARIDGSPMGRPVRAVVTRRVDCGVTASGLSARRAKNGEWDRRLTV